MPIQNRWWSKHIRQMSNPTKYPATTTLDSFSRISPHLFRSFWMMLQFYWSVERVHLWYSLASGKKYHAFMVQSRHTCVCDFSEAVRHDPKARQYVGRLCSAYVGRGSVPTSCLRSLPMSERRRISHVEPMCYLRMKINVVFLPIAHV